MRISTVHDYSRTRLFRPRDSVQILTFGIVEELFTQNIGSKVPTRRYTEVKLLPWAIATPYPHVILLGRRRHPSYSNCSLGLFYESKNLLLVKFSMATVCSLFISFMLEIRDPAYGCQTWWSTAGDLADPSCRKYHGHDFL